MVLARNIFYFLCSTLFCACGAKVKTTLVGLKTEGVVTSFKIDNLSTEVIAGQLITGSCPTGSYIEATSSALPQNPTIIYCVNNNFSFSLNLRSDLAPSGTAPMNFVVKNIYGSTIDSKSSTVRWEPVINVPISSSSSSSSSVSSSSSESPYVAPPTLSTLNCSCSESGCSISATCSGSGNLTGTLSANPYWSFAEANTPVFSTNFSASCSSGVLNGNISAPDFDKDLARIDRNNGALIVINLAGRSLACGYLNRCGILTPNNSHTCTPNPPEETTLCDCGLNPQQDDRCVVGTDLHTTYTWQIHSCGISSSSESSSSSEESSSSYSSESSSSSEESSSSYSSESSSSSEESSSSYSSESSWSSEESSSSYSSESSWSSEESSSSYSSESSWSSEESSSSVESSTQSNPSNYRVLFTSLMYSNASCTMEVQGANIVVISHVSFNQIGSYGTTQNYPPEAWVSWEWTFSPIWDFRTSENPSGSAYYKDSDGKCIQSFNASANFSGRVL